MVRIISILSILACATLANANHLYIETVARATLAANNNLRFEDQPTLDDAITSAPDHESRQLKAEYSYYQYTMCMFRCISDALSKWKPSSKCTSDCSKNPFRTTFT